MTLISALIAAIVIVSIFVVFPALGFTRFINPFRCVLLAFNDSE